MTATGPPRTLMRSIVGASLRFRYLVIAAPPVMLAPVSATGRAMQIGMTSKDHSLIEMSMTAYWTIRARLLRVPGVANVAIWNERLQLMTVQAEPSKMQARQVALGEVMQATADAVDSGLLKFSTG